MGSNTRGMLCARGQTLAGEGLDSSEARARAMRSEVRADGAFLASTRQAVVGRRRSAGTSLSKQRHCGVQAMGAFAAEKVR